MEVIGYIASLLIGVSLGLIGGGGSILTVPVLVYLFRLNPVLATSYSLFVVGSTSMVGAVNHYRKGLVHLKSALAFGAASIATVFLTRKFIVPAIPVKLGTLDGFTITEPLVMMVLFAVLMLLASLSMIRGGNSTPVIEDEGSAGIHLVKLLAFGVTIGLVTGLLGAGGGFLLIPALVFLVKLPMKKAIGTSLMIIALNSLIGFMGDLGHFQVDWWFLFRITTIATAGIFLGGLMGKRLPGEKLKKGFGWFVLLMGVYIIVKEMLLK